MTVEHTSTKTRSEPPTEPKRGTKPKSRRRTNKRFDELMAKLKQSKHGAHRRQQAEVLHKAKVKPEPLSHFDTKDGTLSPPPPVLAQPVGHVQVEQVAVAGSGVERAQAAAMAERLVKSMRVGKVGHDGHEVRLCIDSPSGAGQIEIQVRQQDGRLTATLVPDANSVADAQRLVHALRAEVAKRGIALHDIAVDL